MKWVEVVELVVTLRQAQDAALVVAADAGRAGWVVLRPPVRGVIASAPAADTVSRTSLDSLVTRKSAHSAAHR